MIQYILIKTTDSEKFNSDIKEKLENGWELHGNKFTYNTLDNTTVYTQALIKKNLKTHINSIEQITAS